jgi:uncharacterized RDD family membrane protein YckC
MDEKEAVVIKPERVGFGARVTAFVLDMVIVIVVGGVVGFVFGTMFGVLVGFKAGIPGATIGGVVGALSGFCLGILLTAILYELWEGLTGAAAGKSLMGFKIAREGGAKAETKTLLFRYVLKNSWMLLAFLGAFLRSRFCSDLGLLAGLIIFVGCFFVLGVKRQAFHDTLAKTAVFHGADVVDPKE